MKKFFNLTDLIITIVILGILAVIILLNINHLNEKAKVTSLNADKRNIQLAVDKYNLDKGYCPSIIQPTLGNPQAINFGELHTDYLKNKPQHKDVFYWVDVNCLVYVSLIDAPTDVSVDTTNGTITWTPHKDSSNSIIYEKRPNGSIKLVDEDKTGNYDGEDGKDHLVAEEDKYGLDTPPVGEDYTGYPNPSDEDDTPKGPIVACDANGFICIYTAEELASIGIESNFPLNGNYRLANDIDLRDRNWKPIINRDKWEVFNGIFDGNGFSIDNLTILDNQENNVALFERTENSHIMNLTLNNVDIYGTSSSASLVVHADETIFENISVNGKVSGTSTSGGVVGSGSYLEMNNISFNGEITDSRGQSGGIIGNTNYFTGRNLKSNGTISGEGPIGAILGNANFAVVENLTSEANVTSKGSNVGGLVGYTYGSTYTNAHFKGNVIGRSNVGGLLGYSSETKLYLSSAEGNVTGTSDDFASTYGGSYYGGLIGYAYGTEVINSSYIGDIRVDFDSGEYVGGIAGYLSSSKVSKISSKSNISTVSGYVGGLSGYNYDSELKQLEHKGDISANGDYVGGAVGYSAKSKITNSYVEGNLENEGIYTGGITGYDYNGTYNRVLSKVTIDVLEHEKVNALFGYADIDQESTFTEIYWNSELSNQQYSSLYLEATTELDVRADVNSEFTGIHLSLEELMSRESYNGWDTSLWDFADGYPKLKPNIQE